jgi:hypothetical protein
MKTLRFLLIFLGLNVFTFQTQAQSFAVKESSPVLYSPCIRITIPIIGKAGATISSSGKVKVCPGWAWNKCASVTISFYQSPIEKNQQPVLSDNFPAELSIYDENEQVVDMIFSTGEIIYPRKFTSIESLTELTGDDIILK